MTVCLAAFADSHKAIVCIADKSFSYGDYIQWDSDNSKITFLNKKGTTALMAGGEEATARVLGKLVARGEELGDDAAQTAKICEEEYSAAMTELIEAKFLRPNLLSREDYRGALTATQVNPHIKAIAEDIKNFEMDSQFIICGIEKDDNAFILDLSPPGICTNYFTAGFQAIGSGSVTATSHLLLSEHNREHPIHRVLYDLFDAKVNAEITPTVGYEWDARILYRGRHVFDVTVDAKKLLDKVWSKYNRSPFDRREKDDLKDPPRDWKKMLESFSSGIVKAIREEEPGKVKWPNARLFRSQLSTTTLSDEQKSEGQP